MKRAEDYQRGLDDTWECIRELYKLLFDNKLKDVFGEDIDFYRVVATKTPFECINKVKEYKKKHEAINVGDEVYIDDKGRKAVVTRVCDNDLYNILFYNGDTNCVDRDFIAKSGKYYPGIEMILKQMRSEI